MLASAPEAARRPLQTSRLTMSLSTGFDLPFARRGVNHLAAVGGGEVGPALEEPAVDRVRPALVDRVDRPMPSGRDHPDADEIVAARRGGERVRVAHRD